MPFLGTLINAGAVLAGSAAGSLIGKAFPDGLKANLHRVLGVLTLGIAFRMVIEGDVLKGGFTLLAGYLIGYLLRLERRARSLLSSGGVVAAVVLFCTGPMTVLGSIRDAMGDPDLLLVKSLLDGTVSVVFGATFGLSVALSALLLLLIQGGIEVVALLVGGGNPDLSVLNGTGGLILILIGLNLLDLTDFPTADTLPALVLVPVWSLFS